MMIGGNIKKLRLEQGMTQKNLADKLFVSAQAVSRWENNVSLMSMHYNRNHLL